MPESWKPSDGSRVSSMARPSNEAPPSATLVTGSTVAETSLTSADGMSKAISRSIGMRMSCSGIGFSFEPSVFTPLSLPSHLRS